MIALRRAIALAALLAAAIGAHAQPAPPADDGALALRLIEYEALLGAPLGLDAALCIDGALGRRWPRAQQPAPQQWQRMQEQARQALQACIASAGDDAVRAAGAIRRAMEMQVERQRALAQRQERLRACLAAAPSSEPIFASAAPAACRALQLDAGLTPAQRARLERAIEQGRR